MSAKSRIIQALEQEAVDNKYATTFKRHWNSYNDDQKISYLSMAILPKREALRGNEDKNRELKTIIPLVSAQMWDEAQKPSTADGRGGGGHGRTCLETGLSKLHNPGIPGGYNPSAGPLPLSSPNTFTFAGAPQPQQFSEQDRPMLEKLEKENEESQQSPHQPGLFPNPQQTQLQQINGLVGDEQFNWQYSLQPLQPGPPNLSEAWPQPVKSVQLALLTKPLPSLSPEMEELFKSMRPMYDQEVENYINQQTAGLPQPPQPPQPPSRPEPIMMDDTESRRRAAKYYRMRADISNMCWSDDKTRLESLFNTMSRLSIIPSKYVEFLDRQMELYEQWLKDVGKIPPRYMSDEDLMLVVIHYQIRDENMREASGGL
ncbi:hypothetical protein V8F33_009251 [Rhypophila sp. PSN 637]